MVAPGAPKLFRSTALGLVCGAIGGLGAALVDDAIAAPAARQFLPDGSLRLLVFLASLYAAFGAIGGAALGFVAALLARSDLGRLWRSAFSDEPVDDGSRPATWLA